MILVESNAVWHARSVQSLGVARSQEKQIVLSYGEFSIIRSAEVLMLEDAYAEKR